MRQQLNDGARIALFGFIRETLEEVIAGLHHCRTDRKTN
jgi:hypothetical protein